MPNNTFEEDIRNSLIRSYNERIYQSNMEIASTKSHLCNAHNNYEKLRCRFLKLHTDYHKLIRVTGQLTTTLEDSAKGKQVNLQEILEACMKIFPDLFNKNIRDDTQLAIDEVGRYEKENKDSLPIPPHLLNYRKIKLHLIHGNTKIKCLLLQSLRWKITQAREETPDEVIHEYIKNDLFGLHGQIANDCGKSILPGLFKLQNAQAPYILQQCTARLINTLASFRCGRDYLSGGPIVVTLAFDYLNNKKNEQLDAFTNDMIIAVLQKLSLRKQQRLYMIEIGLIELLIYYLHYKNHKMSYYGLDFSTALLMNLSLQRQGRMRAATIAPSLITTLIKLLEINNKTALMYVNGALNNFLSDPIINEEAKKVQLASILEYYCKQKTGEIRTNLEEILKAFRNDSIHVADDEEIIDDDNEELDILENEIEINDPVKEFIGDLNGEALLATCYAATNVMSKERKAEKQSRSTPVLCAEERRRSDPTRETKIQLNENAGLINVPLLNENCIINETTELKKINDMESL
ncbi:lisH domain-containing protein ARMC9-like isoform X2 [Prorops nasuta]